MIYSLRTKILTVGLAFFAFVGAAFILYSIATTAHYKRLRLEGIRKTVEFETEKVNKIIMGMEQGAEILALDALIFHQLQSEEINETLVIGYLYGFQKAVGGGFWFEPYANDKDELRSSLYAYFDKSKGVLRFDDTYNKEEYDYHSKSWYREIIGAIKRPYQIVWSKPYVDDSGAFSLMTTAGAGVYKKDKLIGVSTIDWEIDEVINELTAIKPTENSFVLLCVPEKDYIISSTRANIDAGASIKSLPWDINADSFTLDGITYLSFGSNMDNGWFLSVQIPKHEIFNEVEEQNNRFSLIIALAMTAMTVLAYFLISKFVNAPLKRLTQDVSRLSLGHLDTHIEINSNDELGLLAQAFNKMTGDLKKSIEENARERAEKERISAELDVAAAIQTSMLPGIFPPFPDRKEFDLYASMFTAKEVGGDFYDFYFIDNDNLMMVIADVSGKGVPAALFMMITKTLIKNCSFCKSPKNVMESVNNKLCENNNADMFVTAFMGIYNIPRGKFVFLNAGHNPPLIKRHGGAYEFLKTEPGYVLAWMKNAKYKETEISLEPGDVLYLYTDGVTEAMNQRKELFGEQRILAVLNANKDCTPKDLLPAVKREIDNFEDGAEQADDITMLALKVNGGAALPKLEINASVENLNKVLEFINTELEQHGCPQEIQEKIEVAVEEIFVNITDYAYAADGGDSPGSGDAVISISVTDKIVIRFEDTGKAYNPLDKQEPDLDKPLLERDIGGLGVFLVKKLMDNVEYARIDNKNVLVMTKTMKSEE